MNRDQGYFTPLAEIWSTKTCLEDNAGVPSSDRNPEPPGPYRDERTNWEVIGRLTKMDILSRISIPILASLGETQSWSNLDKAFRVLYIPFYQLPSPDTCYKAQCITPPSPNLLNQHNGGKWRITTKSKVTICHGLKTFSHLSYPFWNHITLLASLKFHPMFPSDTASPQSNGKQIHSNKSPPTSRRTFRWRHSNPCNKECAAKKWITK